MAIQAVPLLVRRKVIQVKVETTKGTAETTGFSPILAFEAVMQPTAPFDQRRPFGKSAGQRMGVIGERSGSCTIRAELRGAGAAALDGGLSALFQACGLALTTATYTPVTLISSQKTVTIQVFEDGLRKQLSGAMGNLEIAGEFGKRIFCRFDMAGKWTAPTDVAMPSVTHNAQGPMKLDAATLTMHAVNPAISAFTLGLGNTVEPREDVTQTGALAYYMISDRDPTVGMDPEASLVATHDFNGIWLVGTEAALSLAITDATTIVTIAAPKLQYRDVSIASRGGKLSHNFVGQCNTNNADTGDDELTMTLS